MKFITKRFLLVIIGCAILLAFSACATSPTDVTSTGSPLSTSNGAGNTTSGPDTADNNFGIKIAQVDVKGQSKAVLTDAKGFTLYTFKPDTATKTACTGKCAVTWPPLLAKEEGHVTYKGLGMLSAVKDDNGIQVQANSHFLYTFSKDKAPGQANGEGVGGTWFVATVSDSNFSVKVAQVNVKGQMKAVLTDEKGMTLYTFKPDTATKTACTGKCAVTWPPLLAKQVGETSDNSIGTLSAVQDANGIQVQANGHFLYTFSKDKAPGQANGEGVGGTWFVATPANA